MNRQPLLLIMGISIGALAGGICFVLFGLRFAVYAGGISVVIILSKLRGRAIGQSPRDRIMVAAGITATIVLGIAVAMALGGVIGGVIEYVLVKMAQN